MTVLVGREAPDFHASAVFADGHIAEFSFSHAVEKKYSLLFFYPLDFTFVCPSELIALDHRIEAFKKRNVEVMAISVDSQFAHAAWRKTPVNEGGIGPVGYTMVSDIGHTICQSYGVEHPKALVASRAAFLIDQDRIVRAQMVYDLPLGRDIDELLRLVDALQFFEAQGEVCPAGWVKGDKGIVASAEGVKHYLSEKAEDL